MVKKILLGIAGLLVVLVIIGFVLPGKVEITKSITVNAPASYAFEEVNNLENNPKWSYWNNLYKDMKVTYGDIRAGAGALSSWEGEESGNGSMTITESIPDKSVKMDLNFMDQGTAQSWYTFEPEGEGTKVTTGFLVDFGMNPFMRLMGSTMMKSEMNKAFEYNLQHLKEIAEAKPKFTIQLSEEETTPVSYIGITSTASFEDEEALNAQMKKSYDELYGALAKAKVEIKGAPFAIYTKWDEATKQTEFVCAVPVDAQAKVPAKYKIMQTSAGRAVKGMNYGSFDKLKDTHSQIAQYIAFKKLEMTGAPWEVYVTQPDVEKDTSKWVTEVYYPIK